MKKRCASKPKKMKKGGKVKKMAKGGVCRGMGSATHGGKFGRDG